MINADMRLYDYFTYGNDDAYGQPQLSKEVKGQVKMAIHITSQNIQDNINYNGSEYIGLTRDKIEDNYVIKISEKEKLKVLYVNPKGRLNQVFMARM